MFRNSHFRSAYLNAYHFGGVKGEFTRIIVALAGQIKTIAPVLKFSRVRPTTGFKHD